MNKLQFLFVIDPVHQFFISFTFICNSFAGHHIKICIHYSRICFVILHQLFSSLLYVVTRSCALQTAVCQTVYYKSTSQLKSINLRMKRILLFTHFLFMFCFFIWSGWIWITGLALYMETWKNMEKPGIWQFRQKKNWKNLEFWTKITKKPGIFNSFYILSCKILIWHKKSTLWKIFFYHHQIFF